MAGGLVPFLIDWGTTAHPTSRDLPAVELIALTATHPDPESVRAPLAALGVPPGLLELHPGPTPELSATLGTPRGDLRV